MLTTLLCSHQPPFIVAGKWKRTGVCLCFAPTRQSMGLISPGVWVRMGWAWRAVRREGCPRQGFEVLFSAHRGGHECRWTEAAGAVPGERRACKEGLTQSSLPRRDPGVGGWVGLPGEAALTCPAFLLRPGSIYTTLRPHTALHSQPSTSRCPGTSRDHI